MKTIVLHSGGLDSTVLLAHLLDMNSRRADNDAEVKAIGFDYGQRHSRELASAQAISAKLGVEYRIADVRGLRPFLAGSSQTSDEIAVPFGHYAEETMKQTIVPNRNMIMLAIAGAWAQQLKFNQLAYAAHAGDHAIYPDCRESFQMPLDEAMRNASWQPVSVYAPFIRRSKADIVARGSRLGVPFELTWSCYIGGEKHCGKCGTCVERIEAFQLAGVFDPTEYEQ